MPSLVAESDRDAWSWQLAGVTPQHMLREMADAVRALTIERPLVLVLEDLHWSDCLARAGLALWCLGCPDQALEAFGTIDLMEARMFLGETYV